MFNMINIRFSDYVQCAILASMEEQMMRGVVMSSKNHVLTCGACTVVVDENGNTTTSVDLLAGGIKRIASRFNHRAASRRKPATARS